MIDVGQLAQTYGYIVVLIGTAMQGEVVLLICGFLAHQGYLNVFWVWLIAALGASAGDVAYFALGHRYGDRILRKLPGAAGRTVVWARAAVSRHPRRVMLLMRYFFGVRMLLPVVCGMSDIPFSRFLRYNIATSMLWSALFTGLGWIFGVAAHAYLREAERIELILVAALVLIGLLYHGISGRLQRARDKAERKSDV